MSCEAQQRYVLGLIPHQLFLGDYSYWARWEPYCLETYYFSTQGWFFGSITCLTVSLFDVVLVSKKLDAIGNQDSRKRRELKSRTRDIWRVVTTRTCSHGFDWLPLSPSYPDTHPASLEHLHNVYVGKWYQLQFNLLPHLLKAIFSGAVQLPSPDSEWRGGIDRNLNYDASFLTERQEKAAIFEFKSGKLIFKQKPMSLDKQSETLQGAVKYFHLVGDW